MGRIIKEAMNDLGAQNGQYNKPTYACPLLPPVLISTLGINAKPKEKIEKKQNEHFLYPDLELPDV
jgi:hypothetical protein